MTTRSLAGKLLVVVLGLSFLFTAICAVSGYFVFRQTFIKGALTELSMHAKEGARREAFILNLVRQQHDAATNVLRRRLSLGDAPFVEAAFNSAFPVGADGVRRSAPDLFEGHAMPGGGRVYGMGGFFPNGRSMSHQDKLLALRILETLGQVGEAHGESTEASGFTTATGGINVFMPSSPDKLTSARGDAPGERIANRRAADENGPAGNPSRVMRCQQMDFGHPSSLDLPLRRFCSSPVYLSGRYIGAWGTILDAEANNKSTAGAGEVQSTDLIVGMDGEISGLANDQNTVVATPQLRTRYEKMIGLRDTMARIHAAGRPAGVTESQDGRYLVAYAMVPGGTWYLVDLAAKAPLEKRAAFQALIIVGVGLIAMLGTGGLILGFTRGLIVRPLERLARRSEDGSRVDDLDLRNDEIGALARRLSGARLRDEQVMASLEDRVAERTAELDRANRAKSSFLANMSHELRTPLNGVVAVSHLLEARLNLPEEKRMASLVASSAKLLEQVLTDILDVSKIEAGQMTLSCEPFDLATVLDRIGELHQASATAKQLDLQWSIAPEAAGSYLGDEVRLTQILSNLLSNAVKFTQSGSVLLSAELHEGQLRLAVRDTGIGFSPEAAERLFSRFEQADSSITRRFGGTGLGLSICSALVAQMNGTIEAASEEGAGSVFTVTLPLPRASDAVPEDPAALTRSTDFGSERPIRVLLAEDHPTNQQVVALILEGLNVDLTIVEDGEQAVEAFKTGPFDLVLMDMQMPVMDGLEAIRQIRAHEARTGAAPTPVAALTANAMAEHAEASRAAGADLHLSKPIRPDVLMDVVLRSVELASAAVAVA